LDKISVDNFNKKIKNQGTVEKQDRILLSQQFDNNWLEKHSQKEHIK
jgi:hypothetical protein